jgi:hypothetical protein
MSFETDFTTWLTKVAEQAFPDTVKAFCFNLNEPAGKKDVKFGIELVGTASFAKDDPDWACDEAWSPQPRSIHIPLDYSGKTWEECLEKMKELVERTLLPETPATSRLKKSEGIGIGFVDGDLEIIWKPQQPPA